MREKIKIQEYHSPPCTFLSLPEKKIHGRSFLPQLLGKAGNPRKTDTQAVRTQSTIYPIRKSATLATNRNRVIAGASLSLTDRTKHLTEAFPPKLVLTLRRPRYSYYKQVLVSPYMQLMLSPRGCPLEKKGYEVHVLSQEHSGDVGNNCHKWQ